MTESQPLSQFARNLTSRRESLGLEVKDVAAELNRRGFDLAYPTVAGWFNGSRGVRWKVDELNALLEILETDLKAITKDDIAVVDDSKAKVQLARLIRDIPDVQAEALLALLAAGDKK